jgi:hypothetical protein
MIWGVGIDVRAFRNLDDFMQFISKVWPIYKRTTTTKLTVVSDYTYHSYLHQITRAILSLSWRTPKFAIHKIMFNITS